MKAAFLDLDGTLCSGSSSACLMRELVEVPGIDATYLGRALEAAERKAKGPKTPRGGIYSNLPRALRGVGIHEVELAAQRAWPAFRKDFFPYVVDLLDLLRRREYLLVLVTGGPEEIAKMVGTQYGFDVVHGAGLRRDAMGVCTGELAYAPAWEGAKRAITQDMINNFLLDSRQCLAMGNGRRDAEMMHLVGSAVAFEPEFDLLPMANDHGWSIATRNTVLDIMYDLT